MAAATPVVRKPRTVKAKASAGKARQAMSQPFLPVRLAALGDDQIGPAHVALKRDGVVERHFPPYRFTNWLRIMAPWVVLPETRVFELPGATSVGVAAGLDPVLALAGKIDAVLICAGLHDCFATMTGTAPPPAETAASFETVATKLLDRGMTPIFVVPPPCPQFANGLFADRYIAIAATLRRLARQDKRIGLIDVARVLVGERAHGQEPDPRFATGDMAGTLTPAGAFRLAQAAVKALAGMSPRLFPGKALPGTAPETPHDALNPNPTLAGTTGTLAGEGVSGVCADGFLLAAHGLSGLTLSAESGVSDARPAGQRLRFGGRSSSSWGLVKLSQSIDGAQLASLAPGDVIDAECAFALQAPVEGIASVSLQLTPVWQSGYCAHVSGHYSGDAGLPEAHAGVLSVPGFTVSAPLTKLGISLVVNIRPGADIPVSGLLDVRRIVIRKRLASQPPAFPEGRSADLPSTSP
ncbi:hypothetical protein AXW83_13455 [Bosea sp. PAMC 26642]|nr:hypothetical protein AXW83_13455 [Bosea sp. PAMC 26642]